MDKSRFTRTFFKLWAGNPQEAGATWGQLSASVYCISPALSSLSPVSATGNHRERKEQSRKKRHRWTVEVNEKCKLENSLNSSWPMEIHGNPKKASGTHSWAHGPSIHWAQPLDESQGHWKREDVSKDFCFSSSPCPCRLWRRRPGRQPGHGEQKSRSSLLDQLQPSWEQKRRGWEC